MARAETDSSAKAHGYRLGDEAGPHERTFMQWPVSVSVYGTRARLARMQAAVADIANAISAFEPVVMLMDRQHGTSARAKLSSAVDIWDVPTEDLWARDAGPVFVLNESGELALAQLNFNGWGNRQAHVEDGRIAGRVAERLGLPLFDNGLVGEGGGVECDGDGTLMAHESSWVNANRNPGTRAEVEALLLKRSARKPCSGRRDSKATTSPIITLMHWRGSWRPAGS